MSSPRLSTAARERARRRSCRHGLVVVLASVLTLTATAASANDRDLAWPGPFAGSTRKLPAWPLAARSEDGALAEVRADLYCPEHGRQAREVRTRPLVVIVADQGDTPGHVAATATHLATHGLVVAVPHLTGASPAQRADQIRAIRRALGQRRGVVRSKPLLRCLAQQELGHTVVLAHGRSALVVLELERKLASTKAMPAVVWLSPILEEAALSRRRPAGGGHQSPDDSDEELPPGREPPELVLLPEETSCTARADAFFEQARRYSARFAITVPGATHCSLTEPGNPACARRCGAGEPSARAAARRALTRWLGEFDREGRPRAHELAEVLKEEDRFGEIEQRPLEPRSTPIQASASLLLGAGFGLQGDELPSSGFAVGARPALIYGRHEDGYVGFGPYGEVLTTGLDDVALGGGLELVIPIAAVFVLTPAGGVSAWHRGDLGWEPAVTVGGFLGARAGRGSNFLDPTYGLRLDARFGLGDRADRALMLSFQGDVIAAAAALAAAIAWAL